MYTHWHSHGSKDSWKVTVKQQAASLYFRFYAEPLSQNLIRISKNGLGIPYTSPPADSYVCKNSGYPYFKAFIICDFHADKTSNSGLQIAKPSLKRQTIFSILLQILTGCYRTILHQLVMFSLPRFFPFLSKSLHFLYFRRSTTSSATLPTMGNILVWVRVKIMLELDLGLNLRTFHLLLVKPQTVTRPLVSASVKWR